MLRPVAVRFYSAPALACYAIKKIVTSVVGYLDADQNGNFNGSSLAPRSAGCAIEFYPCTGQLSLPNKIFALECDGFYGHVESQHDLSLAR